MGKVSITINGVEGINIFPTMTIAVSALASGDEVILYVCPAALPLFKKGALESVNEKAEHLPDLMAMFEGFQSLGGRILICELGFELHGLKPEDLVEGCEIVGATTFVAEAQGSNLTFSF